MVIYTVFVYNDTKNNITVKCRIFQGVTFYLTTQKEFFMANENKMGYLPIKKLILQMSLPPMCSMFLQYSYNLVDSMFVANINENALAAVSLSFPITTLMISLSIWIGVGINVLIAVYLEKKSKILPIVQQRLTIGILNRRYQYQYPCTVDHKTVLFSIYK